MSDLKNQKSRKCGVRGWLLVLCIILTIVSPLIGFYNLVTSFKELSPFFILYRGLRNTVYIHGFLNVIVIILTIRAGIALWTIKQNAVKIAKNYFWIGLVYSVVVGILPFFAGLPAETNAAMVPELIRELAQALIFFSVWYTYLCKSERVKSTYYSESSENISDEIDVDDEVSNLD